MVKVDRQKTICISGKIVAILSRSVTSGGMKRSFDILAYRQELADKLAKIDSVLVELMGTTPKTVAGRPKKDKRGRRKWTKAQRLAASERAKARHRVK